jgi:N-acetylneuraminic acid mutarotase
MPTGRYGLAAATVNDVVYAIGGSPNHQLDYLEEQIFYSKVEAYNPTNNTWISKADMPTGRFLLGAVAVNGIIYAIGGHNATSTLATVEAFDPATNTWSTKAPMNTARYGMYVGVVNGKIYVAGGSDINSLTATASVESYDPATNTWSLETSMPTAKAFGVGAAVDGVLYTIGASTTSGLAIPNSLVRAYTPITTSVEVLSTNIPSFFTLEQNYPNPFNPSTKISFALPERGNVSLKVYDLLGGEVAQLVNGEIEAGSYDLSFNASDLPSGIYFYKLQAGSFVETKKMILLK